MNSIDFFRKLTNGAKFKTTQKKSKPNAPQNPIDTSHQMIDETVVTADESPSMSGPTKRKKAKPKSAAKVASIRAESMARLRNAHRIRVTGTDISEPIAAFSDLQLSQTIVANIAANGYTTPTPIQMQAIPLMLDRREIIACAPTGSGKTLAFLLPILEQLKSPQKLGFRAVILAPTRELAKQIHRECLWISSGTGLRAHIIKNVSQAAKLFGQKSALKFDILVTTPNRMVYLLKQEPPAVNVAAVEWLVIDECDKLFEMGFRDQLAVVFEACGRSTRLRHAMFSATFDAQLEKWAQMNLDSLVTVTVGGKNSAIDSVDQRLVFVGDEQGKMIALRELITKGCEAPVLIFVDTIEKAKYLFEELIYDGINVDVIHSERTQLQRDNTVRAFRDSKIWFLICTELMGRGIDFKGVNLVINYDFPASPVSYIHRIGRTGRAGRRGAAVTFYAHSDLSRLRAVANLIRRSGGDVPQFMLDMCGKKRKR